MISFGFLMDFRQMDVDLFGHNKELGRRTGQFPVKVNDRKLNNSIASGVGQWRNSSNAESRSPFGGTDSIGT